MPVPATGNTPPTQGIAAAPTTGAPSATNTPLVVVPTTTPPTVAPPATLPAAPPAPAMLPAAPAALPVPLPSTQLATQQPGVNYERQYNHLRGEVMARSTEWDAWRGQAEQVNRSLAADLATAQQHGQLATTQAAGLQEQVVQAQQWRDAAAQTEALSVQNDRLQRLMRYPVVLQQQVVQEVPQEDGTTVQTVVNPYVDLLMSSTLQGDVFEAALQRLAQGLVGQQQVLPAAPATPQPPATPPLATVPAQPPVTPPGQLPPTPPTGGPQTLAQAITQQMAGYPTMIATPPPQPVMTPQTRLAALAAARDEAMNSGQYEAGRALEDQFLTLQREIAGQ